MPLYAVRKGHSPGVYKTWNECQKNTVNFPGAQFKKFDTEDEAKKWMGEGKGSGGSAKSSKGGAAKDASKKSKKESSESESDDDDGGSETGSSEKSDKGDAKKKKQKTETTKSAKLSPAAKSAGGGEQVFVKGASFNIGARPVAGAGIFWGSGSDHNLSEPLKIDGKITLNRAIIHAAVRAVSQIKELGKSKVTINCDNTNLVQAMSSWVKKWEKNGWKTNAGGDVVNKEDLQELSKATAGVDVQWNLSGPDDDGQKEASQLAKDGAKKA